MKNTYTYVDLFCGAGGLSYGFRNANFKNIFAVEYNPAFASTYAQNYPTHNLIVDDIKNLTDQRVKDLIGSETVDIVVGGPPCQGFSKAGNIGRSFIEDERNYLFREFVRFVGIIRPKMFIMENVAALATHNSGETLKEVKKAFTDLGYNLDYKIVNAADYGVAQERRRILIVGTLGKNTFEYPEKVSSYVTVKDVIDDLPKLESGQSSNIPNHIAMKHSEQMLEKMSYVKDGGTREDIPESIRPKSGDARKYIRYASDKPSVCVTGDMRKIFHYSQNRALTCRELARIQSFPDDFIFKGNSSEIQQQIGNAVPPKLACLLAKQVKEVLVNA